MGIVGGPSIVFHRYHKVEETMIRKPIYNGIDEHGKPIWVVPETNKLEFKIQGHNANALYLYCLTQSQLCGELVYHDCGPNPNLNFLSKMFGIMIVNIEVPAEYYNYFSEYPPIFVNHNITGSKPKDLRSAEQTERSDVKSCDGKPIKKRKLVSLYKAEKIPLKTPLLHRYLNHEVRLIKIWGYILATLLSIYKGFGD